MADVSTELVYEVLKQVQQEIRNLRDGQNEVRQELISIRGQLISINQDTSNIYGMLSRQDGRLDKIERRLEL
ncbi:hypothetical protein [Nitratireductor basaltis]|uniref:Uncharacterized protein n=1 Tax=Nitratireductor basaltis TaxID=472175 RepID=A0A084UBF5_9HYPH|nr:hypothetical protein [Nitratireductor basaltis]KFB10291.1 hypothetical protein EL18_01322 [Nitratireductor basaltis]